MNTTKLFLLSLTALLFVLAGCAQETRSVDSNDEPIVREAVASGLTVVDRSGAAVAGAKILIGARAGVPFPGNLLTLDAKGNIALPAAWTTPQPVTIEASGFVRTTYFATAPGDTVFVINRAPAAVRLELRGETTGYPDLKKDGFMDVGLIVPALPRSSLALFNVSQLVSPEVDIMKVFGQEAEIPSNMAIPKQSENYVFPLTFEKALFRVYFQNPGTYRMVATHVRFPFKSTIDDMRGGKSFFELVNALDFKESTVQSFTIDKPSLTSNISVNTTQYTKSQAFSAPRFDAKFKVLGISLAETAGLYYIADAKNVESAGKITLSKPNGTQGLVIAAMFKDGAPTTGAGADEISTVVLQSNQSTAYDFLNIAAAPALKGQTIALQPPTSVIGVSPALTYAVLNKITVDEKTQTKLETKSPQWEVYAPSWASNLDLPDIGTAPGKAGDKMRWEVSFGGVFSNLSQPELGPAALNQITHVSRSSVEL